MSIQWSTAGVAYANLNDHEGVKQIMATWVRDTPEGDEFYRQYGGSEVVDANIDLLHQQLTFHNYPVTLNNLSFVFTALRDSGQLKSAADLVAEADAARPRTRDGRLMSDSQIKWGDYTRFANTAPTEEVRKRMRTDRDFADFMRISSERERYRDGGLRLVGENASTPTVSDTERQRLAVFASEFQQMPASESRRKMLPAFNPGG
jgi:hypothetical protein